LLDRLSFRSCAYPATNQAFHRKCVKENKPSIVDPCLSKERQTRVRGRRNWLNEQIQISHNKLEPSQPEIRRFSENLGSVTGRGVFKRESFTFSAALRWLKIVPLLAFSPPGPGLDKARLKHGSAPGSSTPEDPSPTAGRERYYSVNFASSFSPPPPPPAASRLPCCLQIRKPCLAGIEQLHGGL